MNKLVQELRKANKETQENPKIEYFPSIPMLHLTYEKCKDSFANAIQLLRTLPHLTKGVFKKLESGVVSFYFILLLLLHYIPYSSSTFG